MVSVATVRSVALVICVLGIAGMIVTSILNHNGAAVTFGLITAVAVLCSMVAQSVARDTERRLNAGPTSGGPTSAAPTSGGQGTGTGSTPLSGAADRSACQSADTEELAARVEGQVQAMVAAGADQTALRQLVGEAVRLGRNLAPTHPPEGRR